MQEPATTGVATSFVNLTGHSVTVYAGGKVVLNLPAEGSGVRVDNQDLGADDVAGVEIRSVAIQPPVLPPAEPNVWLIVSQVAALALAVAGINRHDVVFPGPGVSDRGRVVGCRGLRWLVNPAARPQ